MLSDIDRFNVADVNQKDFCNLLMFGGRNLGTVVNRIILGATIPFIKSAARLNLCRNTAAITLSFSFSFSFSFHSSLMMLLLVVEL